MPCPAYVVSHMPCPAHVVSSSHVVSSHVVSCTCRVLHVSCMAHVVSCTCRVPQQRVHFHDPGRRPPRVPFADLAQLRRATGHMRLVQLRRATGFAYAPYQFKLQYMPVLITGTRCNYAPSPAKARHWEYASTPLWVLLSGLWRVKNLFYSFNFWFESSG